MLKMLTLADGQEICRAVGVEVESGAILALGIAYADLYRSAYDAAYDRLTAYDQEAESSIVVQKTADEAAKFLARTRLLRLLSDVNLGAPPV